MILDSVSYAEMLKPRSKPIYLIDRLITERTINIFYGYPGSKKSLAVADMCMAIVSGENFLPSMPGAKAIYPGHKTKKGAVLWMDYENGEDLSYERFTAFGRNYKVSPGVNFFYACLPKLSTVDNRSIALLINEIKAFPVIPSVIVIDTLLRFAKVKDENSSEMDRVMAAARKLVDELQVTIFLISHSNKVLGTRAGNALRGHSSIEGGADSVFRVNSDKSTDMIEIVNEKARRNPIEPFSARWTYTSDPLNCDQLVEARLYYEPYQSKNSMAAQKKQAAQDALEKRILKTLDKLGPTSKNNLCKEVGGNRTAALSALDSLEDALAITITPSGQSLLCSITSIGRRMV